MAGHPGPRLAIDLAEVRRLYVAGNSLQRIAALLGVHYNTLSSRCSRAGLRFPRSGHNPNIRPGVCRHGHDLTLPGARDDHGCVECRRKRDREAKRRRVAERRGEPVHIRKPRSFNALKEAREGRDHTRLILMLDEQRERETRAWLRAELEARIARLRAAQ